MVQKILVLAPLFSSHRPIHFEHLASTYLPSDCFARFQRLMGKEVLFLCGLDEHEDNTQEKDERAIQAYFHQFEIYFDHLIRTSCPEHIKTVQEFFQPLEKKGLIDERREQLHYSEEEKRFLPSCSILGECPGCGRELQGGGDDYLPSKDRSIRCEGCEVSCRIVDLKDPRSKESGSPLTLKPAQHLYCSFDKMSELKPRRITHHGDSGIEVPGHPDKIFAGWFGAAVGGISAAKDWAQKIHDDEKWKEYWLDRNTELIYFTDKENLALHSEHFPALLKGQDLTYKSPDRIVVNHLEEKEFSTDWTIDARSFFSRYSADQIRYAILASLGGADSQFRWSLVQDFSNSQLVDKLGSFLNKVLKLASHHSGSEIPPAHEFQEKDREFAQEMDRLVNAAEMQYGSCQFSQASRTLMTLADLGNVYFEAQNPELLAKEPSKRANLETALSLSIDCLKNLALIASPIIPAAAQKIWKQLGCQDVLAKGSWKKIHGSPLPCRQRVSEPEPLFKRIEDEESKQGIDSPPSYPAEPLKQMEVSHEEFSRLDLRVGQITQAEAVPNSKKLLKFQIDLGKEVRTVVSGVAPAYKPEDLIGKKVIFIANLKPTTIMGIQSQGMILTARSGDFHEIPEVQHLPPGSIAD